MHGRRLLLLRELALAGGAWMSGVLRTFGVMEPRRADE